MRSCGRSLRPGPAWLRVPGAPRPGAGPPRLCAQALVAVSGGRVPFPAQCWCRGCRFDRCPSHRRLSLLPACPPARKGSGFSLGRAESRAPGRALPPGRRRGSLPRGRGGTPRFCEDGSSDEGQETAQSGPRGRREGRRASLEVQPVQAPWAQKGVRSSSSPGRRGTRRVGLVTRGDSHLRGP